MTSQKRAEGSAQAASGHGMRRLTYADLANCQVRDDEEPGRNLGAGESPQFATAPCHAVEHVQPDGTTAPGNRMAPFDPMHRKAMALTVGDNFRRSRKELGLSQEQYGELMGWSRTRVNKAERGRHLATPETVEQWAAHTKHEPEWFYVAHPEPGEDEDALVGVLT